MDRRRGIGIALCLVSACGFGSGALFAKPVYATGLDWLTLNSWRFGVAAALAWVVVLARPAFRTALRKTDRRALVAAMALGVLYVGNSGTYYAGLQTVPASLAALIVYLYPPVVAVLALRFGRPLAGVRAWLALGIAVTGVVLALGGIPDVGGPPLSGLVLVTASPLIYSVWIILSARLAGERDDRTGDDSERGAGAGPATAAMMTATAIVYVVLTATTARPLLPASIPDAAWPGLIGVAVVSTFVAIQAFYAGARRIGAAQASLVSTIEPIWTITVAAILFGERLAPVQLVGGALILVGVLVAQTAGSGETAGAGEAGRLASSPIRLADE
ncbi:MAG: DMT family transporter [Chloroflexota bacterium]